MCKDKCKCATITGKNLALYPKAAQAEFKLAPYNFTGTIKNFSECMTLLEKETPAEKKTACVAKYKLDKDDGSKTAQAKLKAAEVKCAAAAKAEKQIKKLLKTIEVELKCQGLCKPSMWWWYNDITKGPPTKGCLVAVKEKFAGSASGAAIVVIIALVVSFCLNVCTCGAICNKKD